MKDVRTISRLLTGAEEEAHRAGDSLPGAEHLLLSALALPDGSARRAFERIGADPEPLREAIAATHADALRSVGIEPPDEAELEAPVPRGRVYRSNASARRAFQDARRLARGPLRGAHVVAAVAEQRHGTAARALAAIGVDRAALAEAARAEVAA